jgi:hypothetical protein
MNEIEQLMKNLPNLSPRAAVGSFAQIAELMIAAHSDMAEKLEALQIAVNSPIGTPETAPAPAAS